jgi:hypothetical protein
VPAAGRSFYGYQETSPSTISESKREAAYIALYFHPQQHRGGTMNLVDRAKNIVMTPKTEWGVIASEEPNVAQIITGYVIPLALIPAVASVIGWGFVGSGFTSVKYGIVTGVVSFGVAILSVYLVSYVIDFLAPNFGSQKNLGRAFQLVAYSSTPGWVAGILHIFPFIGWLAMLASIYGLYLLYLGLPHMMKTPEDKIPVYLIVSIVVVVVAYAVIGAILGAILFGFFGIAALSSMGGL